MSGASSAAGGGDGWVLYYDEQGHPYYYHAASGASEWAQQVDEAFSLNNGSRGAARPAAYDDGRGPVLTVRAEDYLRKAHLFGIVVWTPRERVAICFWSTLCSLLVLTQAIRSLDGFANLARADYVVHGRKKVQDPNVFCNCLAEPVPKWTPKVVPEKFYWYVARYVLAVGLVLDLLRYLGCSAAVCDAVLGFHSRRRERFRRAPFVLLVAPFTHLVYIFSRPLHSECCTFVPRRAALLDRLKELGFLLFVTGFVLFGDSHHHGFFLLRLPSTERARVELLREALADTDNIDADATNPVPPYPAKHHHQQQQQRAFPWNGPTANTAASGGGGGGAATSYADKQRTSSAILYHDGAAPSTRLAASPKMTLV